MSRDKAIRRLIGAASQAVRTRVRDAGAALLLAVLALVLLLLAACDADSAQQFVTVEATYTTVESFTPMVVTSTPTPAATPTPTGVRFAVIGDFGDAGPDAEAVANLIQGWEVDFIVTTGDNNYFEGEAHTIDENIGQYYHAFIHPYQGTYGQGADVNRFFPALGGHDWRQPNAQPHLDYFTLPGNERYYDVRRGAVHIFILDSNEKEPDGATETSQQGEWLQSVMSASDAPWKLVVAHDPPYSSGRHGSEVRMQWPFREWGATAVLSGDDHTYERIMLDGFPYFVNGLGGARVYEFDTDEIVPGSTVRFNEDHGAMLIEADEQRIRFRFITETGETIDDYMIERTADEA